MSLRQGGPHEQGGERGTPLVKRRYFTGIGSSNVKMVADRHRHAAYHNKHWWRASTPKSGYLSAVGFYRENCCR